jgi:putative transcriptional regulator
VKNVIRELRTTLGWTQADLAERLDVSRQTVNALETGRYDPSLPLAFRVAQLFGRHIEDIFLPDPVFPDPTLGPDGGPDVTAR